MNRDHRSAYLQAMGIESWLPIKALPSAQTDHWVASPTLFKPSLAANMPSNAVAGSEPRSVTAQNLVNRSLALAEELNIDTPVKTASHTQPNSPLKDIASPKANAPVVATAIPATASNLNQSLDKFTLTTTVCDDVLIIDDITAMNFASSAYQHWLNAILLSLGKKILPDTGSVQDRFDWPLPDSGLFDNSQQAAKDIFSAWLQRKLQESNARWVLLMGKAAVAMHNSDTDLGLVTPLHDDQGEHAIKVLLTYGSGELWRQPLLKREFWLHIQPLRSVFNVSSAS